jgi:hypothetical protein
MKSYEQLELENIQLRGELEQLWKENQALTLQLAYHIPKASETSHDTWEVPVYVGYPNLLVHDELTYPEVSPGYRILFRKQYCDKGVFWRVQSFDSKPEAPIRFKVDADIGDKW